MRNDKLFIARDEDGDLYLFLDKPTKYKHRWYTDEGSFISWLNPSMYPEVKWKDKEPKELIVK